MKRIFFNFCSSIKNGQPKKYILSQFPYPSGDLHLGHARVYYIGDSIANYYRMKGYNVIYPMGWDSFGLPAENAAILHGKNPKQWTRSNIDRMKVQLDQLGVKFNWEMQLSTSQPEYYKWTQQIFIRMFKKGLAYKKMADVNWDPVDKTVLANQQVDDNGCSWRSGAKVQKKQLNQWFLKITDYAETLQQDLDKLKWVDKVKHMQTGWIGLQKGYKVSMQLLNKSCSSSSHHQQFKNIQIHFQSIQNWKNAQFVIKKTNNEQNGEVINNNVKKIGEIFNPVIGLNIPVILSTQQQQQSSSSLLSLSSSQFILSNPISNKYHKQLLKLSQKQTLGFQIPTKESIRKLLENNNNKIEIEENCKKLMSQSQQVTKMNLKDWLISRQRYWGCPIPIIYCQKCGIVPVSEQDLPVILPEWPSQGGNPLLKDQFTACKCPQCGAPAKRESDTMDTFVDSSWYYLRFMDSKNQKQIFSPQTVSQMMPVDVYIGGIQHAIMHLLYARFVMKFLQKQFNLSNQTCQQPFKQLVVQGLVKGKTLTLKQTNQYISQADFHKYNESQINITYEKMSKSKFNGLNPNTLVGKYGTDALRVSLFFANPPDRDIDFSEQIVINAERFLNKIQTLWSQYIAGLDVMIQMNNEQKDQQQKQINNNIINNNKLSTISKENILKLKYIFEKLQISIQKRLMHTYVANTMQMLNLIKQLVQKQQLHTTTSAAIDKVKLFNSLICILQIIAPKTAQRISTKMLKQFPFLQQTSDKWPGEQLFGKNIQILIMKGKKLLRQQTIDMTLTDDQIISKLLLSQSQKQKVVEIKRQNKKYIMILR